MIYVCLAEGFEETEAITPIDLLRRAGAQVTVVGVTGKTVTGSHGIPVVADKEIGEIDDSDVELVVLPGGMPGTLNLENSEGVQRLIDTAARQGALLGAICAAPSILGHKGLLNGKTAVCFPGFEKDLTGAVPGTEETVRDGNIITSRGAGSAVSFGLKLVEALYGEKQAEELGKTIQWRR